MNSYRNRGMQNIPESVLHLIILNVLFYVVVYYTPLGDRLFSPLSGHYFESPFFKPWQVFTHMFMHGDFFHILFNVFFGIYMFGGTLAKVWGNPRFLFFYFTCGIGAYLAHQGFLYYDIHIAKNDPSLFLGASGAVYGVLVAFAFLFPNTELFIMFLPIPIKAKYAVVGLIVIDTFLGFSGIGSGVAHFAHLGGALTGYLLLMYWQKNKNRLY